MAAVLSLGGIRGEEIISLEESEEFIQSGELSGAESQNIKRIHRTNGHSIPVNGSETILEFYQKVTKNEKEDVENQEILLNLIERSKESRKNKGRGKPSKVDDPPSTKEESDISVISNYVTKPPSKHKPKKKVKNIVTEMKKKRKKRRKVSSKQSTKKHSNMQVRDSVNSRLAVILCRCTGRNGWREHLRISSMILCSGRS